jgi:hypothetical protein
MKGRKQMAMGNKYQKLNAILAADTRAQRAVQNMSEACRTAMGNGNRREAHRLNAVALEICRHARFMRELAANTYTTTMAK